MKKTARISRERRRQARTIRATRIWAERRRANYWRAIEAAEKLHAEAVERLYEVDADDD